MLASPVCNFKKRESSIKSAFKLLTDSVFNFNLWNHADLSGTAGWKRLTGISHYLQMNMQETYQFLITNHRRESADCDENGAAHTLKGCHRIPTPLICSWNEADLLLMVTRLPKWLLNILKSSCLGMNYSPLWVWSGWNATKFMKLVCIAQAKIPKSCRRLEHAPN